MKHRNIKRVLSFLLVVLSAYMFCSCANNSAAITNKSFDTVNNIKIGWNLGNSLDAEGGEGLDTEINWGNPRTTEKMILDVKKMGFNTIRIPATWGQHCDEDGIIDTKWLKRVKEVVDYAYDNGLYVILDSHHDNGYYQIDKCVSDEEAKNQNVNKMKSLWSQIANEFVSYDSHLIFEVMNEPRTIGSEKEWQGGTKEERQIVYLLNSETLKSIRETGGNNETRPIILPSYGATADTRILKEMEIPDDDNIIVSIHAYSPYNFAMNADASGEFTDKDKKELDNLFKAIDKTFIQKGIPVIMGEFGVINKDNIDDRCQWADYYVKAAKSYGIPCIVWDNNIADIGSETFGLYNRAEGNWYYPELVKTYIDAAS